MKKRILSIALVVAMLALAVAGGTLAYLTDTDHAMNTMTTGNVDISQNEYVRNVADDGTVALDPFVNDAQKLILSVYHNEDNSVATSRPANWDTNAVTVTDGKTINMPSEKVIANQIDKIVNVTNEGSEDIYARTIFFFETDDGSVNNKVLGDKIAMNWVENDDNKGDTGHYNWLAGNGAGNYAVFTIDDKQYIATVHYYGERLAEGESSYPSLTSLWMPGTKYVNADLPADGYSVLAFTQAVQAEGFYDDNSALDAAFGEFTEANINAWLVELGY